MGIPSVKFPQRAGAVYQTSIEPPAGHTGPEHWADAHGRMPWRGFNTTCPYPLNHCFPSFLVNAESHRDQFYEKDYTSTEMPVSLGWNRGLKRGQDVPF